MKKLFFTLLAITIVMSSSQAVANAYGKGNGGFSPYQLNSPNRYEGGISFLLKNSVEIKPGDDAWSLAQKYYYKGITFGDIISQNPFLQEPGRVLYNPVTKWIYPVLYPGEMLTIHQPMDIPVIRDSVSPSKKLVARDSETEKSIPADLNSSFSWLVFWLIFTLIVLLIAFILHKGKQWANSNPTTSGPPEINGGVTDENVVSVFERKWRVRILSVKRVRFYGRGIPHYNFGPASFNSFLNNLFGKRFNGEEGYECEVEDRDGNRSTRYGFQACGNDVAEGNFYTGITTVPVEQQPKVLTDFNDKSANEAKVNITTEKSDKVVPEKTPLMTALSMIENHIKDAGNEKHKLQFSMTENGAITFSVDYRNFDGKPRKTETASEKVVDKKQS